MFEVPLSTTFFSFFFFGPQRQKAFRTVSKLCTCGEAPSFCSSQQGVRWGCGTAPTASPTLLRCRRFVWNNASIKMCGMLAYKATWLEALQWYRPHLELLGGGTPRGMIGHWRKCSMTKCQETKWFKDLARWNHLPQILLTRRLSSMANSTTESRGSFLFSSITSSFSACPIVLQKIGYFHEEKNSVLT